MKIDKTFLKLSPIVIFLIAIFMLGVLTSYKSGYTKPKREITTY